MAREKTYSEVAVRTWPFVIMGSLANSRSSGKFRDIREVHDAFEKWARGSELSVNVFITAGFIGSRSREGTIQTGSGFKVEGAFLRDRDSGCFPIVEATRSLAKALASALEQRGLLIQLPGESPELWYSALVEEEV